MRTDAHHKIQATHLERDALLYIRQSSLRQVMENQESTKRQYALRERAVALGWPIERIHIIDNDLGQSGAQSTDRDGFTELVNKVAMGEVGIVLGLEVSRLARNNADWHRLLELAGLSATLILDEDGVYDPTSFNDRLLLGLKGAMSEAELHVLKARLQGGIRNKAERGELHVPLPIGLVYQPDQRVGLDPDRSIQSAVRHVFELFRETRSAMAVVKRFQSAGLTFPRRIRRGINKGTVIWGTLEHSRVLQLLHNPRYAGAFVFGRTRQSKQSDGKVLCRRISRDDWQVLIQQAHAGYIDWGEFERNQETLRNNAGAFLGSRRGSVPREGAALLQGRVICGRCGERMRVRYQKMKDTAQPYYQCTRAAVREAGKICQSVRGTHIDVAIGKQLTNAIQGSAPSIALAVHDEIKQRLDKNAEMRAQHLERARYQAELAQRRYLSVDPENRLVAESLEAHWNEQLRQLDDIKRQNEAQDSADGLLLSEEQRQKILELSSDFPRLWHDNRIDSAERKRLIGLLIEDVTITLNDDIRLGVSYRGGCTETLSVPRPKRMCVIKKTPLKVVKALDILLETCTDQQAADALNLQGYRNWRGEPFTAKKVRFVRRTNSLLSHYERLQAQGFRTARETADRFKVSPTCIRDWARDGLLTRIRWGNGVKSLYRAEPGVMIEKGRGGCHPKAPQILPTVALTTQEIV